LQLLPAYQQCQATARRARCLLRRQSLISMQGADGPSGPHSPIPEENSNCAFRLLTILAGRNARGSSGRQNAQTYAPGYPICMQILGAPINYYDCSFTFAAANATCRPRAARAQGACSILILPAQKPPGPTLPAPSSYLLAMASSSQSPPRTWIAGWRYRFA